MIIVSESELEALSRIGRIVATAREEMVRRVRPGITTRELDLIGEKVLDDFGAYSAPKSLYRFPGVTCISINDEAAHGIPGGRVISQGDMVNIDVSAELDGYFSDTGATVLVEPASDITRKLCDCARSSLDKALESTRAGKKINQIGKAIHDQAKKNGFTVIKNLTGHGIGRKLHDEPRAILNYYERRDKKVLKEGMVLALETFISTKAEAVIPMRDGWTLKTPDGSLVAQFEHTVVVTGDKPIILTEI